ncbi:MAG: hypothetical protein P8J29_08640 [Rhodospirillales bacterium]|nr:hypothetical protein [Rhodospirillales bacterium]
MPIAQTQLYFAVQRFNAGAFDEVVHICSQLLKETPANAQALNLKRIA